LADAASAVSNIADQAGKALFGQPAYAYLA